MKKQYRLQYKIIPIIFIAFLFTPLINEQLNVINNDLTKAEKRKLSEKPEFNVTHLDPFPQQYEAFYNDHFGLRKFFIVLNNYVNFRFFKRSTSYFTIIGKENWLFLNNKMLPNRSKLYTKEQINILIDEFKYRINYYASLGIKYYAFIIPSKASVYSEYLPDYINIENKINKTQQLMQNIKKEHINNIFYLKNTIDSLKKKELLYFINDHHWNDMGAFYGAEFVLHKIQKDFPKVGIKHNIENFNKKYEKIWTGTLSKNIGLTNIISETVPTLSRKNNINKFSNAPKSNYKAPKWFAYKSEYEIKKTTGVEDLPNVLIIRDSFAKFIFKFLSPNFNVSTYIWDGWKYKVHPDIIKNENPDIVIDLMVESRMYALLKHNHKNNYK